MTQVTPKAIFVGAENIGKAIESRVPDWDFVAIKPTINEIYEGWDSEEITRDVQVIFILSRFFLTHEEEFRNFVASIGPYCMFCIIDYDDNASEVREAIEETSRRIAQPPAHFYFIDRARVKPSLNEAVERFKSVTDEDALQAVSVFTGEELEEVISADASMEPAKPEDTAVIPSGRLGRVVTSTASKGGTGKTSTNALVAADSVQASRAAVELGLEERPLNAIIVDVDVRDGQVGFVTGYTKPTVVDLWNEGINDESLDRNIIHDDGLGVDLLLAAKRPRSSFGIKADFYAELIPHLKKRYDLIFFDTSSNYLEPLAAQVCYPQADTILFVTEPVLTSLFSMTRWIIETTNPKNRGGFGIPKSRVKIVINKYMNDIALPAEQIIRAAQNVDIAAVVPSMPRAAGRATNERALETLLELDAYAKPIRTITQTILGDDYKLPPPATRR